LPFSRHKFRQLAATSSAIRQVGKFLALFGIGAVRQPPATRRTHQQNERGPAVNRRVARLRSRRWILPPWASARSRR